MPNTLIKKIFYAIISVIKDSPNEFERLVIELIIKLSFFNNNYIISLLVEELSKNVGEDMTKNPIGLNLARNTMLKTIYLRSMKAMLKKYNLSSEIITSIVKCLFNIIESNSEDLCLRKESMKVFTFIASKGIKYKFKEDSEIILHLIEIGSKNEGLIKSILKSLEQIIRLSRDKEKCREEIMCFIEKFKETTDRSIAFIMRCLNELMKVSNLLCF